MDKFIYVVTIILLSAAVRVNSLQCYECVGCTQVNETHLVTCGEVPTTTPAPSTSTTSGGSSTSTGTTAGGSNSTNSTESTTLSPEVPPTNGTNATNENFEVRRFKREVLNAVDTRDVSYVCATIKATVNDTEVVGRGCLLDQGDDAKTCAPANTTGQLTSCVICKTDKCNSAVSIEFTSALLFVAACVFVKSWM